MSCDLEGFLEDDAGSGKTVSFLSKTTNKKNSQGEFDRNMCTKYIEKIISSCI